MKTSSISSNVFPFVSGTKNHVQTMDPRQKTEKNTYAPKPVFCTSGGVITPYRLLDSKRITHCNSSTYDDEVVQPV